MRNPIPSLGILLAAAVLPLLAGAQGGVARGPSGRPLAVTLPFPTCTRWPATDVPPGDAGLAFRGGHLQRAPYLNGGYGAAWSYPFLVTSSQYNAPAPAAAYPVPYYYPVAVPVRTIRRDSVPPPVPFDPTRSNTLIVGGGADGGGGVMRITRSADALRVTWLGTTRPVREAKVFLSDSARVSLRTHVVDVEHPVALLSLAGLDRPVAFTGLTVVYADGSKRTTLVPLN